MRVAIVRTDMGQGLHMDDLLSRNQYPYASSVAGQSRVIRRPTSAELAAVITANPFAVYAEASDNAASVDTSTNDTLRIRASSADAYSVIAVTAGAATAKTLIRDDLNAAFVANDLPFIASVVGTNQLAITTTGANRGPNAYLQIDTVGAGSTLSTAVGYTGTGVLGQGVPINAAVAALIPNIYPTGTTVDVSTTAIAVAFPGVTEDPEGADVVDALAELVAPKFVETGDVLLSFSYGKMSRMRDATFQPGGTRAGLPAGISIAVVEDDGVTPFVFP